MLEVFLNSTRDRFGRVVVDPINKIVDDNLTDVTTSIGSFIVKAIMDKFTRQITFHTGVKYADQWLEQALYGILYENNNIKKNPSLEMTNADRVYDGSGLYYRLGPGSHKLKYRKYDILLLIKDTTPAATTGRVVPQREYTIITYSLDPMFTKLFEQDMLRHRNSLLKIRSDSEKVSVWTDGHEGDGYTYWDKRAPISKRHINTIYLPREQKKLIINTINTFFAEEKYYKDKGRTHNLKILFHGPPGTGKDSIAKMIASEWNRNLYYVTGGKGGHFIPNALQDYDDDINHPLFLVSDIDKYPFLINDTNIELDSADNKEEKVKYKLLFGNMLNALDGVMSGEHRIIIMTTNHPEKFSPVLTRKGRVDLIMEIGYVIPEVFRKYFFDEYHKILPQNITLKDPKTTIADMQFDSFFCKMSADEFLKKYCK